MKFSCKVSIQSKSTLSELPLAWTAEDYKAIMEELDYAEEVGGDDLEELCMMVLADQEPEESAELLLRYKLGDQLTEGQIKQLAIDMQEDKICEEYPIITLHKDMFAINQLLYKSFNGTFPNCKAISVSIQLSILKPDKLGDESIAKEIVLKALAPALGDHSIIERLYDDQLDGEVRFDDAEGIIWSLDKEQTEKGNYIVRVISSEYWLQDLPAHRDYEATFEIADEVEVSEED